MDVLHEGAVNNRDRDQKRNVLMEMEGEEDELLNILMELKQKKTPMEVGCWSTYGEGRKSFYDSIKKETTTCEWYTAPYIVNAMDTRFDLDPASPGRDVVP